MTTLVNPTTLPDETTRLLPPSTFETLTENTRGGGKGGKGGTEGANEKNEKKSNSSFALKFWPQKNTNTTEGKLREGEEEDHHPNHRVKRSGFEDASQIIHTPRRKTMGTTTTVKDDGEIEDDFAKRGEGKPTMGMRGMSTKDLQERKRLTQLVRLQTREIEALKIEINAMRSGNGRNPFAL